MLSEDRARQLVAEWMMRAKIKFRDARLEEDRDPAGAALIRHGGMCYFNAANELASAAGIADKLGQQEGDAK